MLWDHLRRRGRLSIIITVVTIYYTGSKITKQLLSTFFMSFSRMLNTKWSLILTLLLKERQECMCQMFIKNMHICLWYAYVYNCNYNYFMLQHQGQKGTWFDTQEGGVTPRSHTQMQKWAMTDKHLPSHSDASVYVCVLALCAATHILHWPPGVPVWCRCTSKPSEGKGLNLHHRLGQVRAFRYVRDSMRAKSRSNSDTAWPLENKGALSFRILARYLVLTQSLVLKLYIVNGYNQLRSAKKRDVCVAVIFFSSGWHEGHEGLTVSGRKRKQIKREKAYLPQMGFSCSGRFHWKHEQEERHHPLPRQEQGMAVPMHTQEMLENTSLATTFCSFDTSPCTNFVLPEW